MFKTAAAKIAHNSTIPALVGNRDIRSLQDLITSEKAVLQSLQRLRADLTKANECLRHWGAGEGDDLQDVLSASSTLLGYLSPAFIQMASHEGSIREHMKAVRTMEENLDELRRRRKAVVTKADSAEKRLSKMNPEHKNIQQQTELLNNLREQIKSLDWDILSMEARLGDFKRSSAKNWMMLKFGGLLEFAEKATIVGEMGKLVIEEIPLDITQPGQGRKFYTGYEKTEKYLSEAQRCISEVVFDPTLVAPTEVANPLSFDRKRSSSIDGLPSGGNINSATYAQGSSIQGGPGPGPTPTTDEFGNLGDRRSSMPLTMPSPMRIGEDGSRIGSAVGEGGASNLGSSLNTPSSPSASQLSGATGGQFSTFPARKASLPHVGLAPPPGPSQNLGLQPLDESQGSSFAAEVASALAYAERDGQQPIQGKTSLDGPAPSYETHEWTPSFSGNGLPRGAAPPTVEPNPWDNVHAAHPPPSVRVNQPSITGSPPQPPQLPSSRHVREGEVTEHDQETQLPYASPPPTERQLPSAPGEHPNRHVRFDGGHGQAAGASPVQERIPSPPPLDDEEAHKAAAREVSREMDALTFNPPPGPPPGHVDNRAPSPLLPPAPPFAQQRRVSPPPVPPDLEQPSAQPASNAPPSLDSGHQTRPSMAINVHAPSPSHSFNSTNASAYGTPPEMPAAQPLRTGSPASVTMAAPGTRTISAAAFKRPGIRTPSGGGPPSSPSESRPLPDVTPLALRKKKSGGAPSLPSSPSPNPPQSSEGQGQTGQVPDPQGAPPPDYESSYDVISSYSTGDQHGSVPQAHPSGGGGYEQGKFATNLDAEGLR